MLFPLYSRNRLSQSAILYPHSNLYVRYINVKLIATYIYTDFYNHYTFRWAITLTTAIFNSSINNIQISQSITGHFSFLTSLWILRRYNITHALETYRFNLGNAGNRETVQIPEGKWVVAYYLFDTFRI